jgi:hypothetical protein
MRDRAAVHVLTGGKIRLRLMGGQAMAS